MSSVSKYKREPGKNFSCISALPGYHEKMQTKMVQAHGKTIKPCKRQSSTEEKKVGQRNGQTTSKSRLAWQMPENRRQTRKMVKVGDIIRYSQGQLELIYNDDYDDDLAVETAVLGFTS